MLKLCALASESGRSNVVEFRPRGSALSGWARLADNICFYRHPEASADWLREASYFLLSARRCEVKLDWGILSKFESAYQEFEDTIQFHPEIAFQILMVATELERQGMPGEVAGRLAQWIRSRELIAAEQSDSDRLMGTWLLWQHGGAGNSASESGLLSRTIQRLSRADIYAQAPKGLSFAREVSWLTDMGGLPMIGTELMHTSVRNAMFYAYLGDEDLTLVRLKIAAQMLGAPVPALYSDHVKSRLLALDFDDALETEGSDDLCFLMAALTTYPAFASDGPLKWLHDGGFTVYLPASDPSPRNELISVLRTMDARRSGEWSRMKPEIESKLSFNGISRLRQAEKCPGFEAFFEVFSRPYERL